MLIRLYLDVAASETRLRFERDVDLPAVPRVADWVDLAGRGAAQPVERVVFSPLNEHVDVVLETVTAQPSSIADLRALLEGAGWTEMVEANPR